MIIIIYVTSTTIYSYNIIEYYDLNNLKNISIVSNTLHMLVKIYIQNKIQTTPLLINYISIKIEYSKIQLISVYFILIPGCIFVSI